MGIPGFTLAKLTDPPLPGKGPGRHTAERPNFVLNEFSVGLATDGGPQAGLHCFRSL